MRTNKVLQQQYLELSIRNLDLYEDNLRFENHLTNGESLYIKRRRDFLVSELTELTSKAETIERFSFSFSTLKKEDYPWEINYLWIRDDSKDRDITERSAVTSFIDSLGGDLTNTKIVVRDPSGSWDGWDIARKRFISLSSKTAEEAVVKLSKKMLRSMGGK